MTPQPGRFSVKIDTARFLRMAATLVSESSSLASLRANFGSRPCIYGVYDGPLGGLQARESLCRGCLRCMIEHPDVARIELSAEYKRLGDRYWKPEQVLTVWNEAATGRVPVRGMGYGGPFRGPGFDDIWTDFSEIVRPTRDGIHGREYISTAVDLGTPPLPLGDFEQAAADCERLLSLPLPMVLEAPRLAAGDASAVLPALASAASRAGTLLLCDSDQWDDSLTPFGASVAPVLHAAPQPRRPSGPSGPAPTLIEWASTEENPVPPLRAVHESEDALWCLRLPMSPGFEDRVVELVRRGAGCLHLRADYHGREWETATPRFVTDLTRSVHGRLVGESLRDRVTLIVGGGIVAAEHVPKTILCGADLVALETAPLVALQAAWKGDWTGRDATVPYLQAIDRDWAAQRVMNLLCAWRDQLLEIMGAMGLRDVRRLRGEVGRAMFAAELEHEIFGPLFGRPRQEGRGHA
ncbi:MAG: hypothetical protein HY901_08680 [Deltaproteobacteria bacterium]|nr:hypothetical protein [Deltaproteobacteria bacterium]